MRKVLIITYYWPPSGGVGVQRWLKFSKYLPAHNWSPIIYTPSNPDFDLRDHSLEQEVSSHVTVLKRPIWEPFHFYKKILGRRGASTRQGMVSEGGGSSLIEKITIWLRGNLLVPDARKFWVRPSIKFLHSYLSSHPVDLVVTTGPPHSMHLIGLGLKEKLGIKWIADFRDPWTQWDVLPRLRTSNAAMNMHRKLEKQVLSKCDLLLTVSPRLRDMYVKDQIDVKVITNGFDFAGSPSNNYPDKFRLSHAGLLNETKFHPVLWEVLGELVAEDKQFKEDLEISLAGNISTGIMNELLSSPLKDNLDYRGFLDHGDILSFYEDSFVLMLFLNQTDSAPFLLPSKIFEYIKTGRYILGLGVEQSDSNDVLVSLDLDPVIDYEDKAAIKERVLSYYAHYQSRTLPELSDKVNDYSRESITRKLTSIFEEIIWG